MRMTSRVAEIIEKNFTEFYIPFVVKDDKFHMFPMYYGRIMQEDLIAFPVTGATGIDKALEKTEHAQAVVVDRAEGYEAYVLEGVARYVTHDLDYELVAAMRNEVPGFPIHAAVVFQVKTVHLAPPP